LRKGCGKDEGMRWESTAKIKRLYIKHQFIQIYLLMRVEEIWYLLLIPWLAHLMFLVQMVHLHLIVVDLYTMFIPK